MITKPTKLPVNEKIKHQMRQFSLIKYFELCCTITFIAIVELK